MPATYHGFGTKFYGEADKRPDGTYITTEWLVAGYVPIVPLRSLRLIRDKAADERDFFVGRVAAYRVIEKPLMCWRQVFMTYLFVMFCASWWAASAWLFFTRWKILDGNNGIALMFAFVVTASLPFFGILWVRRESYRSRHGDR